MPTLPRLHPIHPPLPRCVCIVLHDVAPARWPACDRLLAAIAALEASRASPALRLSLLAVPRYHGRRRDREFEQWLQALQAQGHEVLLHGFSHLDEGRPDGWMDRLRRQVYTRGEGEFAGLTRREAADRLEAGLAWIEDAGLEKVGGFVPPAWLLSRGSWEALCCSPLRYTCTLRQLVLLPSLRSLRSQALVWSDQSAWRRELSLRWNRLVAQQEARSALLRIELHPTDADHAATRASWEQLLRNALRQGRQVRTLGEVAASMDSDGSSGRAGAQKQLSAMMAEAVPISTPPSTSLG